MSPADTIAAIATAPGRGAIAIVRASGPDVPAVAARVVPRAPLRPKRAQYAEILDEDGYRIDRGMVFFSEAPHSYTGEHTLELHIHGSPIVAREVMRALLAAGARAAEPGEFTRRAFMNGKLDLHAATAVADLIGAETRSAARAALANLGGGLANEVRRLRAVLAAVVEECTGAIDFPDEVPDPDRAAVDRSLASVAEELRGLLRDGEAGRLVRDGIAVAIVGPPNAGKSSLLNALLGEARAIVSDVAGTTRDTIEESISIDGVRVRLIDTAGIRAHTDALEAAGIARTQRAMASARLVLLVLDGSKPPSEAERQLLESTGSRESIVFFNKADLGVAYAREVRGTGGIVGSVYDRTTLRTLRSAIARRGWGSEIPDLERPHLASIVEFDAARSALTALTAARSTLADGAAIDLIVSDLQAAFASLGHISGDAAAREIVDGVFARFCIGK
ncbi:MAG: tRNA uridine-5-carboxymethylaminomethyl(34) synthesis GTPase MnmE [Candidatus Eremiobacteraeota bacterium]|nr:tRNA uridine-5-carboxymethylaminomethyl(34) synthesis GTPase MnmE [Candidatus Eremiobacteraeota bacterium]